MKRAWTWLVDLWRVFVPLRSPWPPIRGNWPVRPEKLKPEPPKHPSYRERKAEQTGYPPIPGDWPDPPEGWRKPDWPPVARPPKPPAPPLMELKEGELPPRRSGGG